MSPASSAQPSPALAYAVWLDSLTRAGWDAKPAIERATATGALGRVSAAPIVARWPSPRSDCSAMDGIAVSADVLAAVLAGVLAGNARDGTAADAARDGDAVRLAAGSFEWVDTGDAMPEGADTVVMREWLLPQEDGSLVIAAVRDARELARGKNVRRAGEDFAKGEVLVPAGRRLRPGDLAAAAAAGRESVAVTRPPAVAIIPTGDEIRPVGSATGPGEIFDTNSLMLAGRCRQVGAVPLVSDVQPDDPDVLAAEIRRAAHGADLVLVIAGSSRGRDDHAGAVLAQVGGVAVAGVAVRPGHPALLGHAKRLPGGIAPVIGLPGYPLAAAVIFELFAAPLLAAIAGLRQTAGPALLATLDRDWRSPPGIEDWVLVTLATAADPAECPRGGHGGREPPMPEGGGSPPCRSAARRDAGQARGRIDQPARPRRRLVADCTRSGVLRRGLGHRGSAAPGRRRLSPRHDARRLRPPLLDFMLLSCSIPRRGGPIVRAPRPSPKGPRRTTRSPRFLLLSELIPRRGVRAGR